MDRLPQPSALPTPLCDVLQQHPLDSNDVRAWRKLARLLERRCAELEAAFSLCHIECSTLHHVKKDQHSALGECPVEKRIRALLENKHG